MTHYKGKKFSEPLFYGLVQYEVEKLAQLTIDAIVREGVLGEGYELVGIDRDSQRTDNPERRTAKMRRFLLHTVVKADEEVIS